jgi:hypothetical protein
MNNKKYALYNNLEVTPRLNDTYKILKDYSYKDVTVEKGYHTDGASVPRFLWSIWPPNRSTYLPAVVVHDYLCDKDEYKKADTYFKEIMEILEINKITIWFFYNFVVIYHRFKYGVK